MRREIPQNIAGNACFRSSSRLAIQMLEQKCAGELSRSGAVGVLQHKKYLRAGGGAWESAGLARPGGQWRANLVRSY
jgi:hypothetical protein